MYNTDTYINRVIILTNIYSLYGEQIRNNNNNMSINCNNL